MTITQDTGRSSIPAGTASLFWVVSLGGDAEGSGTADYAARSCTPTPPNEAQCGNGAVVLAALGSGQHYAGDTTLAPSPQLAAVYEGIKATAGTRRPAVRVIDYPAPSVVTLLTGDFSGAHGVTGFFGTIFYSHLAQYLAGEKSGVGTMWATFNGVRRTCPTGTKIALIGYSQGAMVVHDFLTQLAAIDAPAAKAAIAGAVLVADPERVKHSQVVEFGTASNSSYGVCDVFSLATACTASGTLTEVPAPFLSRTVSVCLRNDPVCSTSDDVPTLISLVLSKDLPGLALAAAAWVSIHDSYASQGGTRTAGLLVGRWVAKP